MRIIAKHVVELQHNCNFNGRSGNKVRVLGGGIRLEG